MPLEDPSAPNISCSLIPIQPFSSSFPRTGIETLHSGELLNFNSTKGLLANVYLNAGK